MRTKVYHDLVDQDSQFELSFKYLAITEVLRVQAIHAADGNSVPPMSADEAKSATFLQ